MWALLFFSYVAYSYRRLYRDILHRPLYFHTARRVLALLHWFVLIALLLAIGKILIPAMIIIFVFLVEFIMREVTYRRAVFEMVDRISSPEEDDTSRRLSFKIAKDMIDADIKMGRR